MQRMVTTIQLILCQINVPRVGAPPPAETERLPVIHKKPYE
jgi:hypothetical protein